MSSVPEDPLPAVPLPDEPLPDEPLLPEPLPDVPPDEPLPDVPLEEPPPEEPLPELSLVPRPEEPLVPLPDVPLPEPLPELSPEPLPEDPLPELSLVPLPDEPLEPLPELPPEPLPDKPPPERSRSERTTASGADAGRWSGARATVGSVAAAGRCAGCGCGRAAAAAVRGRSTLAVHGRDLDRPAAGHRGRDRGRGDPRGRPAAAERRRRLGEVRSQPAEHGHRDRRGRRIAHGAPGPVGELADRARARSEVRRDLLVAVAVDRVAHDHVPLPRGQRAHGAQDRPQPLAAQQRLVRALDAVEPLRQRRVGGLRVARDVERRVARDPVQPRAQRLRHARALARQRGVGVDERLLQRVVGGGRREQAADIEAQRRAIARDDRRERALVAGAGEGDQPLVGLRRQHPRAGEPGQRRATGPRGGWPRAIRRRPGCARGRCGAPHRTRDTQR